MYIRLKEGNYQGDYERAYGTTERTPKAKRKERSDKTKPSQNRHAKTQSKKATQGARYKTRTKNRRWEKRKRRKIHGD